MDRPKADRLLAIALLLAVGCRPADSSAPSPPVPATQESAAGTIELLTWWGRLGQSEPTGALISEHAKRYPHDYVINATTRISGRVRETIRNRMMSGDPPDVFECNVGYDMRQWVSLNGLDDRDSKLVPLDDAFPSLWRVVAPKLLDYVAYQGKLYGVPATVHRVNSTFYNKALLAANGLTPPASVAELKAAGRKLRAAGIPLFAMSGKEPWQLGHFVFEGLLVAREGPEFYRRYLGGAERPDDPRIVKTLEEALELLQYANSDWQELTFLEAADLLARGKAAMSVDGDWMTVYFAKDGLSASSPIGEGAFPGSEETLVFTADLFSLPVRAKNAAGAKRFLSTIMSPDTQRVLSRVKGSISPRTDLNDAGLTTIQQHKVELLRRGNLALALSGIVPKQFHDDVNWALLDMAKRRNIKPALDTLRSRYHLLLGDDKAN